MESAQLPKLVIDDAIPFLENRLDSCFRQAILPGEEITREDLMDADGLLVRTRTKCNASLLDGTPVTFIATGTIGLDHIDRDYCDSHGIEWQNAPGCNAPAVAQYVWRALFQLGFGEMKKNGKMPTLGVVGMGNVGSIVVEWGRRLGFNVIVCDPPRAALGLDDEDYLSLHELMSRADAVTFHTPMIRETARKDGIEIRPTYHLADREVLENLRPGAILVNAARGGIVDEESLREIKDEKGLRVCIDTWEGEPAIDLETLKMADIATFHIAGYSRQGKERATRAILEGLERHFNVELSKEGLTGEYQLLKELSREAIERSYDIMADDRLLREAPECFETRRNAYKLREEVSTWLEVVSH